MKTLLRATCLCLGFAGMAHAESDALIVDTSEGSMFGRLTGSGDLSAATADLRRFFAETGHDPVDVDFDALEAQARASAAG